MTVHRMSTSKHVNHNQPYVYMAEQPGNGHTDSLITERNAPLHAPMVHSLTYAPQRQSICA